MHPIKPNLKTEILPTALIIIMAVASVYFYQTFPETVPTHWNFQGEIDGWGSRATGAFAIPTMTLFIYLLMLLLPLIDPKKQRYSQFTRAYHIIKNLLIVFMALLYATIGASALGYFINVAMIIPMAIGILFIVLGNYMGKIKPNWFMGIRTPWTMSSESVWNKTHRMGGKVFIISGILLASNAFLPAQWRNFIFIFTILFILIGTIGYSYLVYQNEKK